MKYHSRTTYLFLLHLFLICLISDNTFAAEKLPAGSGQLQRLQYNNPGLKVDLGVGLWAWPLPMDYDGDGDNDLVVVCPDVPYNGAYFFENTSGNVKMPVFKAAVKIDKGIRDAQICHVDGKPRVMAPNTEYVDFVKNKFSSPKKLGLRKNIHINKVRANQWKYSDFDGDGVLDLIVGVGDWKAYGWDNAYDDKGNWTNGPLHGYVYLFHNSGTNDKPKYAKQTKIKADGKPIDVYGMPTPNLADFDGDGDLDIICGEFLDKFSYFENVGTRKKPKYAAARRLTYQGKSIQMDLEMITPTSIDWDKDGDVDLIVGDEDGRVALVENSGKTVDGLPQFLPPKYFQQEAKELKFGALVTPWSFDWDGDGDEDLICGNSAGYICWFENLGGGKTPKWNKPVKLQADGKVIRIMAGHNGSIQGPCEAKWGYTTLSVADWNHDGLPDIIVNSIWGKVEWYQNVGDRKRSKLTASKPIDVQWKKKAPSPEWNWYKPQGKELVTQWRTTPVVHDWNRDGLNDLVMLDHEGYLSFYERKKVAGKLLLSPPQRIFHSDGYHRFDYRQSVMDKKKGGRLQLNSRIAGPSGRRKFCITDWDNDGRDDLLVNSFNVSWLRNVSERKDGLIVMQDKGQLVDYKLAGHTTSPTVVDWNKDGKKELLIGAEDGYLYYQKLRR